MVKDLTKCTHARKRALSFRKTSSNFPLSTITENPLANSSLNSDDQLIIRSFSENRTPNQLNLRHQLILNDLYGNSKNFQVKKSDFQDARPFLMKPFAQ